MITPNSSLNFNTPQAKKLTTASAQPSFGRRLVPASVSRFYENLGYKTVLAPIMNLKTRRYSNIIREHLAPLIKKVNIPLNTGSIYGWEVCPQQGQKYILFLHGIKGSSALPPNQIFIERVIKNTGYGLLTPEYRGSAELSDKTFNFRNIVEDAKAALKYLYSKGVKPEDITIVSHCIGSIPAANIAAEEKGISKFIMLSPIADGDGFGSAILRTLGIKKVPKFLENTFNKLVEIFMPHDMNSIKNIKKTSAPVTIMRPQLDSLVSTEQCNKMLNALQNSTTEDIIEIPKAVHALGKDNSNAIISQI